MVRTYRRAGILETPGQWRHSNEWSVRGGLFHSVVCAKTATGKLSTVYDEPARRPRSGAEYQPLVRLRVRYLCMF